MALQQVQRIVVYLARSCAAWRPPRWPKFQLRVIAHRRRELFSEKSLKADILHMRDQLRGWTEGGLFKEAYGISP
jgi:hypothetical protein